MRLGKRKILKAIREKLDAIDQRELEVTGKRYFPTKLDRGTRHLDLAFRFTTPNGIDWFMRMPILQKSNEVEDS